MAWQLRKKNRPFSQPLRKTRKVGVLEAWQHHPVSVGFSIVPSCPDFSSHQVPSYSIDNRLWLAGYKTQTVTKSLIGQYSCVYPADCPLKNTRTCKNVFLMDLLVRQCPLSCVCWHCSFHRALLVTLRLQTRGHSVDTHKVRQSVLHLINKLCVRACVRACVNACVCVYVCVTVECWTSP